MSLHSEIFYRKQVSAESDSYRNRIHIYALRDICEKKQKSLENLGGRKKKNYNELSNAP